MGDIKVIDIPPGIFTYIGRLTNILIQQMSQKYDTTPPGVRH